MRALDCDAGAALVEQLLALLLGAVIVTSLYAFYRAGLYQLIAQEAKTATLQDARGALDIMVRDLRNAGSWGAGTIPPERGGDDPDGDADTVCNRVYAAGPGVIHLQMDLNGNNNCTDVDPRENIRYELTGPTGTCPGVAIVRRNGDCLVANVMTPAAGKLFTFYDDTGTDLGDTPPVDAIKRVRIAFAVQEKNPDPKVGGILRTDLATTVVLRNKP